MFKTSPNFTVGSYLKYHFINPRCMHEGYDSCFVCVCVCVCVFAPMEQFGAVIRILGSHSMVGVRILAWALLL